MDEKQKQYLNRSLLRQSIDEQDQNIDHIPSSRIISHKRRRSSTINDQSDPFSNHQHLIFNQDSLPITTTTTKKSRKRPVHEDYFTQEYDQHVRKFL